MDKNKILEYTQLYKATLLENVIPFWTQNSPDWVNGGYYTCLDRTGKVFDTDKFVWLQGRQAWMFSFLYQEVDRKEEWLAISKLGIDFLEKYGSDSDGNYYFSLTQKGRPLIQPYNVFSDCFVAMAFARYGQIPGNESMGSKAIAIFQKILDRQANPKGIYNKVYPGTRPLKNFALPMILSNLCLEMEPLLDQGMVEEILDTCVQEVMVNFLDQDKIGRAHV